MSKDYKALLDTDSGTSSNTADAMIEIVPIASLDSFDPFSDIFAPASNLFVGGESRAAPVAGATIDLLFSENWPALIASVDTNDLTETLVSSTKYVISDPTSGISVKFIGTGLSVENFFGYTILATGTVTGFNVTLGGVSIATGSGYSLSAATIQSYAAQAVEDGSAQPLFDMWFSIPTTVSGTAAVIKTSLSLLEPYVQITAVEIDGAPLSVSVLKFNKFENILNKVTGGFSVQDTVLDIKTAIIASSSPLVADAANITSLVLTDGATTTLKLKAAQDTAAASLLAKITGPSILAVQQTDLDWVTTGHGASLTIHDIVGVDAITANGASETFVFGANWGTATVTGLATHATGAGHDSVTLAASEFAQGAISLLADATLNTAGTAVIVTAGTDTLTFTGFTTRADFKAAVHAGDFTFV